MADVIEVDDRGIIPVPASWLGEAHPHSRVEVRREGESLILRAVSAETRPFWETATIAERLAAFDRWVDSHTDGPGLSDEAISRDTIYD